MWSGYMGESKHGDVVVETNAGGVSLPPPPPSHHLHLVLTHQNAQNVTFRESDPAKNVNDISLKRIDCR